jgi:hypothetical protein
LSADNVSIFAFVTDSDGGGNLASTSLTIENAQPSVALNSVYDIVEGDGIELAGIFADASLLDAHTLAIDWAAPVAYTSTFELPAIRNAAGAATLSVGNTFNSSTDSAVLTITSVEPSLGLVGFSVEHRYLDDGYSPGDSISSNYNTIAVNVTDDDFGANTALTSFYVNDIAPLVTLNSVPDISENEFAAVSGSYTDIGLLDGHSVSIAWDDPNAISNTSSFSVPAIQDSSGGSTLNVDDTFISSSDGAVLTITSIDGATGQVGFSVQHQYLNDGLAPGNDSFINQFTIGVTVTDDDFQSGSNFTSVTVHNVAPELAAPTPATQTISEGGVASFDDHPQRPGHFGCSLGRRGLGRRHGRHDHPGRSRQ